MKNLLCSVRSYRIFIFLTFALMLHSQTDMLTLKHTVNSADKSEGKFSITSQNGLEGRSIKVIELSISVSGKNEKKIYVSADLIEISEGKSSKNLSAVVKSYADPNYSRDDLSDSEKKDPYEGVTEETLPRKMYLQLVVDGSETIYDFYDANDLESIIDGVNSEYDANLEVVGSGRNVYVKKSNIKTENQKSASKVFNKESIAAAGLNIDTFESELIKIKILRKDQISSYTLLIEEANMYINGNQISDKLAPKFRNMLGSFGFEFSDE